MTATRTRYDSHTAKITAAKDAYQNERRRIHNDLLLSSDGKAEQLARAAQKRDQQITVALAGLREAVANDRRAIEGTLKERSHSADEWAEKQYHHAALVSEFTGLPPAVALARYQQVIERGRPLEIQEASRIVGRIMDDGFDMTARQEFTALRRSVMGSAEIKQEAARTEKAALETLDTFLANQTAIGVANDPLSLAYAISTLQARIEAD